MTEAPLHSANEALFNFLKPLYPKAPEPAYLTPSYGPYGGYHPDVSDFLWHTLPRNAEIVLKPCIIYSRLALAHPENGAICAFMRDEGSFGLRLPAAMRATVLATAGVRPYTEIGEEWVRFGLFSLQDKSPAWLKAAGDYTGTL